MKKILLILPAILFSFTTVSAQCNPEIQAHVYHPSRLQVITACKTVTGTVFDIKTEADGDKHIQLKLDPGQGNLLNAKNTSVQKGCLVLEIICSKTPTQTDAIGPCSGFTNPVPIPQKGDHIRVTGTYITDVEASNYVRKA